MLMYKMMENRLTSMNMNTRANKEGENDVTLPKTVDDQFKEPLIVRKLKQNLQFSYKYNGIEPSQGSKNDILREFISKI